MFGVFENYIQLPPEMLCFISKNLSDTDCVAVSTSGAFKDFASVYNGTRGEDEVVLSYKYFFVTQTNSWRIFFKQMPSYPSRIKKFVAKDCYWIPAELLCDAIKKISQLEELSVNGTKVGLPHLASVFDKCPKITKLDFSYQEKNWNEIQESVRKMGQSIESIIKGFQRLTSLKIFTRYGMARDYVADPWICIIRMLTWCRDCIHLSVQLTYIGHCRRSTYIAVDSLMSSSELEIKRTIQQDLFPQLSWMSNLQSLFMVKLGVTGVYHDSSNSNLLRELFEWIFSPERAPKKLTRLWIQDFPIPYHAGRGTDDIMQSFCVDGIIEDDELSHKQYSCLEHLADTEYASTSLPSAPRKTMKYFRRTSVMAGGGNEQELNSLIRDHPDLERLDVTYSGVVNNYFPNKTWKLLKLKVLRYNRERINQEIVDALVEVYPNIQILQLIQRDPGSLVSETASLSALRFRNLTSLNLYGNYQRHDGFFLLSLIEKSKKLQCLHLSGGFLPAFLNNFDGFLQQASYLKELRLEWKSEHSEEDLPVLHIFQSLLRWSRFTLERLAIIDIGNPNQIDWKHPSNTESSIVHFAAEMMRLVCCCVSLHRLDPNLIREVNRIITEKVLPKRPSIWFHLDRKEPDFNDENVPWIHYHEMIHPTNYVPLPIF